MTTLPIVEVFGPTLQGEGPSAGRAAYFVRFAGCNLSCSWCDTAYTWDASRADLRAETMLMTVESILDALPGQLPVVLTGGEPLLQQSQRAWGDLLGQLGGRAIWVETNGTIAPSAETLARATQIVVSPKLANAGQHRGRQDPRVHPAFTILAADTRVHLKIVCATEADVAEATRFGRTLGYSDERIWVMPQAATREHLVDRWPTIAEAAAREGVNATTRLHVLAWDEQRCR